jgi:hypothetical protein
MNGEFLFICFTDPGVSFLEGDLELKTFALAGPLLEFLYPPRNGLLGALWYCFLAITSLSACPSSPYSEMYFSCGDMQKFFSYITRTLFCSLYSSSHILHLLSISIKNCCCGPNTLPGLHILIQPINSAGGKLWCFIA